MAFINLNSLLSKSGEGQGQLVLYSGGPGSNGTSQDIEGDGEREEYPGSSELPAASVLGMAQSVGVTISEEVAAALGDLAMKKLRAATLLAVGFSDHENASGLRTVDFSKAEAIFNAPSYGHRSDLPEPRIIPIVPANISILEEGPEIDLMATISSPQISEFRIRNFDPEFHVHHAVINSRFASNNSMEEDEEEEELGDDDESSNESGEARFAMSNNHLDCDITNHMNDNGIQNGPREPLSPDNEDLVDESSSIMANDDASHCQHQYLQLDKDWLEYMRSFVDCFLKGDNEVGRIETESDPNSNVITTDSDADGDDDSDSVNRSQDIGIDNENEFQYIVRDLIKYGAFPIADVICDFFCDYLGGLFTQVSSTALHRIVLVVDAFMSGSAKPSVILMRKLSSVLIEILVRPPDFQMQSNLIKVFMKILQNHDELLTWACTYITEVLKRTSEMTADDISDEYKCLLHQALLLANGLELLDIKVAHEFGWDSSIEGIKRNHYQAKEAAEDDGNIDESENIDTLLEEEFNKFTKSNSGS